MIYWFCYILILFVGSGGVITLLVHLHRTKIRRPLLENLTLAALALFITLMGLEFYLKLFFAQPDAHNTLARRNWYARYYQNAYNSLHYRDVEWTEAMIAGKIKVMVVGDSFVEGLGVEYPEDRFSNRLGQMLGPQYTVFNLGDSGTDTKKQIEAIINFPYKPDILIWSYVVNDIEGAAGPLWLLKPPDHHIPPLLYPLVENSHLSNFVYWRLYRIFQTNTYDYVWDWYLTVYNDPEAWWRHQQELLSIYHGAQAEQIPLIVVVFPGLTALDESEPVTSRVIALFKERDIPVLDVAELVKDIPVDDRIASPVDPHPSELTHELVAEELYRMFIELNLADSTPGP
jgi:hypothetical protein